MSDSNAEEVMSRGSDQVMIDDTMTLVFDEMSPKDLICLQRVSNQFKECILLSPKRRKCFSIIEFEDKLKYFGDSICNKRHHQRVGEHFQNNLNFAVVKDGVEEDDFHLYGLYLIRERIENLKLVSNKCTGITSLAIYNCHINESVIRYFNEELKNLKCLALNHCMALNCMRQLVTSDQMKSFSKKIIYLNIGIFSDSPHPVNDDQNILDLIRLFDNLVKLVVDLDDPESVNRLIRQMKAPIDYIYASTRCRRKGPPLTIDDLQNLHQLRSLQISFSYWARRETIEAIIKSLNLKRFEFGSKELSSTLMYKISKSQKQLKALYLSSIKFIEDMDFKRNIVFEKVMDFRLSDANVNPIVFKQIIDMFPNIKCFVYKPSMFSIRCQLDQQLFHCKTCIERTYDLIPRLESVKYFHTLCLYIGSSLLDSLDRFPNLSHLKIQCSVLRFIGNHNGAFLIHGEAYISTFNPGPLKVIMNYVIERCEKAPKRLLKFQQNCTQIPLPSDFQIPRNLKIINSV